MFKSVKIFISYRRGSSAGHAGRIYENLKDDFDVFFDINGINIGDEFKRKIEKEIKSSTILISILDEHSSSEFEKRKNKKDFVLFELEYAHKNSIPIIPLLLNGSTMPIEESLPKSLDFLPRLHAFDIRHEKFYDDISSLKREIHEKFGQAKLKRVLVICSSLLLILLLLFTFKKELKSIFYDGNGSIQNISNWLSIGSSNSNNITIEYKDTSHE